MKQAVRRFWQPFAEPKSHHKSLFGGGGVDIPKPTVTRMPDQEDPSILAAKRRRQEEARARGGRQSTILSDALRTISGSTGNLGR